jgi:Hsp20/alpha crystallin family
VAWPAVPGRCQRRRLGTSDRHLRTQGRLPGNGRTAGRQARRHGDHFEDGLLTIQGERQSASYAAGEKAHRAERRYGAFRRSITLPSHVEADKIEASAQDGVLQVLVPKPEEMQAKHIKVRAGQGHAAVTSGTAANNGS